MNQLFGILFPGLTRKNTCSFEGQGTLRDAKILKAELEDGKHMLLSVDGNQLPIQLENPDDGTLLYYYCSGGASLAGTYERISGPLDESQLGNPSFERTLSLGPNLWKYLQLFHFIYISNPQIQGSFAA
jgi:hypothetical protein